MAKETIRDPVTGFEYDLLTGPSEVCRKLYFSTENFTADDGHIVFYRDGESCRLIEQNIMTGEENVLADSREGWSIGTFGIAREKDEGYLLKGNTVFSLDLPTGKFTPIAGVPEGASPCGHYTSSKNGLLPMTFKLKNGIFCLAVTDPGQMKTEIVYYSDTPLGHCQACPGDDRTVFFVHETGGDALQRMWQFDLVEKRPFPYYVERWDEWITHETWSFDGSFMTFIKAPNQIWIGSKDGHNFRMVSESDEYHHCAPSRSGRWITSDRSASGEVVLVDAETGKDTVLVTGHRPSTGILHQHPSFNRKGDKVLFSAPDFKTGGCRIGLIDLNQVPGFKA